MSLNQVNAAWQRYEREVHNRTEAGRLLLLSIVAHLNAIEKPKAETTCGTSLFIDPRIMIKIPPLPEEEAIPLREFLDTYRITIHGKLDFMATDGCIGQTLRKDEDLMRLCVVGHEGKKKKWKIKPLRFIHYVSQARHFPKLSKRCHQWLTENKIKEDKDAK